ncbi:Cyanophycinase [Aquisphaera giovannonii]|uniref:Cyanophycinase n=1 Tax=Aquisphaera giovannonii TaxID=406548 RepID=A0A5B9VZ92_9BACT|nr:cyanophycinase [Aquisphaera giovannonii]QEH33095.1 Cyanophycinase [Aquisphaera giovannonii]
MKHPDASSSWRPTVLPCVILFFLARYPSASSGGPPSAPPADAGPRGSLVIVGGGGMPASIRSAFLERAGGKAARLVVIPTASEDADGPPAAREEFLEPWRKAGVEAPTLLHTRSRDAANAPGFSKPIEEATAVWVSGGDQSRVTDAYLGTAVERSLRSLLDRGGVIGGTSAGAAIMSRVMITGGRRRATVGTGFGFLPGVVVDQHALRRNRIPRLLGVLAEHPSLSGIAIDERTAFVVDGSRWRVLGDSYVVACRRRPAWGDLDIGVYHAGDEGVLKDGEAVLTTTTIEDD